MFPIAYRRLLRHRVTLRRNTTSQSTTGATKFNYVDYATNVPANLQDDGGRLRQGDFGQTSGRRKNAVFGPETDALGIAENDLVVLADGGTYRVTHVHRSIGQGGEVHHVECTVEQFVPAGDP